MSADHSHSHSDHDHADHDHAGHDHSSHNHAAHASGARLGIAALLTGGFMVAEIVGGLISGSLALLADAGHMFTDFASLALAWFAVRVAARPADWKRTYGFDRFSVLVAFVNGLALFVIAAFIMWEAVDRLMSPVEVMGPVMLGVAIAGLLVNILAFRVLHGADNDNLNVKGAMLHVMGDLLGSVAAIAGALIIMATGWTIADPILSVLVVLLILRSAWFVVKESGHILLEGAPRDIDNREVAADLVENIEALEDVHHVHAWSISQERRMMTLHACLGAAAEADPQSVITAIKARVKDEFGIGHVTVEIETGRCADEEAGHGHAH
ncbi:cation diffusion facilitator family transporter [Cucumibacter marinus]|uniref:cation diffusion facilitator family transporter n=1 Tax=Cucumibacter marinus TaxID=1121252 RepID=UPI00048B3438|nr:cation diffusion facilitator family transporter [Cucumibacter marinus]